MCHMPVSIVQLRINHEYEELRVLMDEFLDVQVRSGFKGKMWCDQGARGSWILHHDHYRTLIMMPSMSML